MTDRPPEPCHTAHLFRPLLGELLAVLRGLADEDWQRQTLAPQWKVRDVAAHLLDGDLRKLSFHRDAHMLELDKPPTTEREITALVNALNAAGVAYAARLSPRTIVDLLEVTGGWVADFVERLPPHGGARFGVSWAGEEESENWLDTGREYTERWHHQMQIRDATSRPLLLGPEWLEPLLDISVRALPHAFRSVDAAVGTELTLEVSGETEGAWTLARAEGGWQVRRGRSAAPRTTVRMTADHAWRMFYNALRDESLIQVEGDWALAAPLLRTRSVIV